MNNLYINEDLRLKTSIVSLLVFDKQLKLIYFVELYIK